MENDQDNGRMCHTEWRNASLKLISHTELK